MLSLGLARAFSRRGLLVQACKKGPDYIDAAWLALAARSAQSNLDPFFTPGPALAALFARAAAACDIALVEGNRGLFDGLDITGSCSTAQVARTLEAPVLLIVDCTKMTRTAAALVKGCCDFEPGLRIGGVVLNRSGNARHAALARQAVEDLAGVPVFGVLPRQAEPLVRERHMGLVAMDDCGRHAEADALLNSLADFVALHCDCEALLALAADAPVLRAPESEEANKDSLPHGGARAQRAGSGLSCSESDAEPKNATKNALLSKAVGGAQVVLASTTAAAPAATDFSSTGPALAAAAAPAATDFAATSAVAVKADSAPLRLGYVQDAALWFYYRENLYALERAGASLVPLSLLQAQPWPELDGLYLGGGLPELHAERISGNRAVLDTLAVLVQKGLPLYAECGGFMVLCRSLAVKGREYPMAGLFPCRIELCERPQGLGYVEAQALRDTPFFPAGFSFKGHEFHFSRCVPDKACEFFETPALRLNRGKGLGRDTAGQWRDGLVQGNCFASYMHIYAPAVPHWAVTFVDLCRSFRASRGLHV